MDELKPCPFCGGEAFSREYDEQRPDEPYGLVVYHDPACFLALHADHSEFEARWNTRSPVTDEMVERAAKALEPFANAAMGIKEFDPDFPLDGAALRASFDWYDKCQGEALKRNSVRLQDINFAAETHAAITAALGGPHG